MAEDTSVKAAPEMEPKATKAKGKNAPYKLDEKIARFNDKRHSNSKAFMLILN